MVLKIAEFLALRRADCRYRLDWLFQGFFVATTMVSFAKHIERLQVKLHLYNNKDESFANVKI